MVLGGLDSTKVKIYLVRHKGLHTALLLLVLLGTFFSAVSSLELSMSKAHHQYAVVPITCFILVCLFALQHYGLKAMFADLGHFSNAAIQIAFTFMVYPALILAYVGLATYLSKNHDNKHHIGFYISVPGEEAMNSGIAKVVLETDSLQQAKGIVQKSLDLIEAGLLGEDVRGVCFLVNFVAASVEFVRRSANVAGYLLGS